MHKKVATCTKAKWISLWLAYGVTRVLPEGLACSSYIEIDVSTKPRPGLPFTDALKGSSKKPYLKRYIRHNFIENITG